MLAGHLPLIMTGDRERERVSALGEQRGEGPHPPSRTGAAGSVHLGTFSTVVKSGRFMSPDTGEKTKHTKNKNSAGFH